MTDKEKLIKIKSLADKMYYAAFNLTTDASLLRKATDDYHQFIINEYHKEEPVSEDLEEEIGKELTNQFGTHYDDDATIEITAFDYVNIARHFANWQKGQDQETIELAEDHAMLAGMEKMKEQLMAKVIDAKCFGFQGAALFSFRLPADNYLVGSEVKVIVVKEN